MDWSADKRHVVSSSQVSEWHIWILCFFWSSVKLFEPAVRIWTLHSYYVSYNPGNSDFYIVDFMTLCIVHVQAKILMRDTNLLWKDGISGYYVPALVRGMVAAVPHVAGHAYS